MTRHDMTLLHILTYGSCAHGKGKRTEEKKKAEESIGVGEHGLQDVAAKYAGLNLACSVASLSHPSVA